MAEAEARHRSGMQNLTEFIGSEPSKKRKRRTSFTPQALEILNSHFEKNTHPSGQEMTEIAEKLNYDREVVRVWFCNKRQALKNTIKRLKSPDLGPAASMDPLTDSLEELPKWTSPSKDDDDVDDKRSGKNGSHWKQQKGGWTHLEMRTEKRSLFESELDGQFTNKNYVLSVWLPQLCKWTWRNQKKRLICAKYVKKEKKWCAVQRVLDSGRTDQTIAQILVPTRRDLVKRSYQIKTLFTKVCCIWVLRIIL